MTWDEVKAKFPNEVKALVDEAYTSGVKAENKRLEEIDGLEIAGHKNLVTSAKL